jgi:hypothetical protein
MAKNFIYMFMEYVVSYQHLLGQISSHVTCLCSGN